MSDDHPLDQALAAVDQALAKRPVVDGHAFTAATKAVCAYRDDIRFALRERRAQPGDDKRLNDANIAVTLLMAGHFTLGETPWGQIEGLRAHLQAMRAGAA